MVNGVVSRLKFVVFLLDFVVVVFISREEKDVSHLIAAR